MKNWQKTFVICALALLIGPAVRLHAQPGTDAQDSLFEHSPDSPPGVARLRKEVVDNLRPGGTLNLNVRSDGVSRSVRVTQVARTVLGSRLIRGRIEGRPDGSFLLIHHGAASVGNVWVSPTERYAFDGQSIREQAASPAALCACASDPLALFPGRVEKRAPAARQDAAAPLAVFDVLIVYTPAALAAEGSLDALTAQAESAMGDANACYLNSGIPIEGRIVGVRAVNYVESGEIRTDLHHLAFPDDGVLDEVQGYRDEAQADFVCLLTRRDSADGYRGYAEILTGLTPDAEILGFSVVDVLAATTDHLFAHELGHNMGCDHDRENTTGLHLFDFSYGWRFTGQDGTLYRDVMAYAPGVSVPYFGTPAVSYDGMPTGVADYADTARTLIASAPTFVNFRAADGRGQVSVSASVVAADAAATGKHRATFAFERTGSVAQALDVGYQTGGTAANGVNYKILPGRVTFAAGSHFAKARIKPLAGGPAFGLETVGLSLLPGDNYVPADSPDGSGTEAAATIYDRLPLVNVGSARLVGSPPRKVKVRVQRLGRLDGDLVVRYRLKGTAVAGVDYREPIHRKLIIPAGRDEASIVVHLLDAPAMTGWTIEVLLKPSAAYNVGAAGSEDVSF